MHDVLPADPAGVDDDAKALRRSLLAGDTRGERQHPAEDGYVGIGGIGANALQGARMAGARAIAAIDPLDFKLDMAKRFGATHTYKSIDEALEKLGESTWGRGFDVIIMTMGVGNGEALGKAFWLGAKRARIVVTNIHPTHEQSIQVSGAMLTLFEKRLIGSLFGISKGLSRELSDGGARACARLRAVKADLKTLEEEEKQLRAEILYEMGDAETARIPGEDKEMSRVWIKEQLWTEADVIQAQQSLGLVKKKGYFRLGERKVEG